MWRGRPRPRACEMKDCIDELTCNIKYDKVTAMRESITFTVSLPPAMAKQVDRAMKVEHRTRSELVREALRVYLSARRGMDAYNRGDAVTLQEYLNGMDRRPRRTRKKVS